MIHNAEFDMRFLNAELAGSGREPLAMDRVVDTLALARKKHPGQPNSLDALCDRYQIDRSRRVKHGALLDAEILVEIYSELTGGRQRSSSFDDGAERVAGLILEVGRVRIGPRRSAPRAFAPGRPRRTSTLSAALGEAALWLF